VQVSDLTHGSDIIKPEEFPDLLGDFRASRGAEIRRGALQDDRFRIPGAPGISAAAAVGSGEERGDFFDKRVLLYREPPRGIRKTRAENESKSAERDNRIKDQRIHLESSSFAKKEESDRVKK
jgi:hypothetical protein